ncbi:hypothetical protein BS50DRAFT_259283 [Corynespora cassiicola Philippines]|uniref:Aflatoxin regulatory protein domain-containing protein n=1 Tax=Corynespora cassiicola Philippines TaxID=1448308 RepID=A0A2T2N1N7_CORCC|nr:hypothetical protein BS50DRAFT_259283 [Corynespora cassiicola Philippines]
MAFVVGLDIGHTDGWSAPDYEKPTSRGFISDLSCMDDLVSPGLSQPFCASPFRPPFTSTRESGVGNGPDQQARSQCLDVSESHAEPLHLPTETPSTNLAGFWAEGRGQADGRDFASMVSALGLGTRGHASGRATSASEPMQRRNSKVDCRCREMTTSLFEELCAESASSHQKSLDALLGHFRGAMSHATTMLDCHVCRPQVESNMLLAMAGHYMGTMLERIVMGYMRLRSETDGPEDMVEGSGGDMWFSTYRIDNKSERMQVLGCLVWVQMLEFSRLLERLKTRAGPRNGPGMLLGEADKKVGAIRTALLSCRSTSSQTRV